MQTKLPLVLVQSALTESQYCALSGPLHSSMSEREETVREEPDGPRVGYYTREPMVFPCLVKSLSQGRRQSC